MSVNKILHWYRFSFLLLLLVSVTGYYGCENGINIFSLQDDVQLGEQLVQEMKANTAEFPVFTKDPSVKKYIEEKVFAHILETPAIKNKTTYRYSIEIIDNPEVMNAFALPGGPIYVYTGLLKYLDSEAALAGVLAHEIAHIEERHATERMTKYYGVQFLLSLILGDSPSQIAEVAANFFVGAAFLANSRSDEDEADLRSMEYLRSSRYYAGGVKFFFEKMRDDGLVKNNSSKIETFLSTHPEPVERIKVTEERLKNWNLPVLSHKDAGDGIFRDEYAVNIKNKLK